MHSGWWSYITYDETKTKSRPVDRALLVRVFGYARPYLFDVTILTLVIVVSSLLGLVPPLLLRALIDTALPQKNMQLLNLLALGLFLVPLLTGFLGVAQRHYGARAGEGIIYDLRNQMYSHLQRMSIRFFTDTKSGEVVSRFSSDVVGAQSAITGTIPEILTNVVTLVSTLIVMLSIEWRLTLLSILVLPLFVIPARYVARRLRVIRRRAMEYNADMSSQITETLSVNGALLTKTFGRQDDELEKFRLNSARVRDMGIRRADVSQIFFVGIGLVTAVGTALVYWAGGLMVLQDVMTVGTIVAFAAYLARLYGPLSSLSNVQVEFASSMVSFERVFDYLDMPIEIQDQPGAVTLDRVAGQIRFEQVSFRYAGVPLELPAADPAAADGAGDSSTAEENGADGDDVERSGRRRPPARLYALQDIDFVIEPGMLVALVGPSGAGKTTITYLLPRLYDPTAGRITLDGHDLRRVTLASLERQMGMVTQETYLFHDTVRANLLFARPAATEAELDAACRAANVYDVIMAMPNGYDTVVGERGYRLSGGEKQRISIARVILKDPRILILDEATSHLDSQSEALIQEALEPLLKGRTSVVIAHRLSTILAADKILVLDQGRLVEQGTHGELLAQGGVYAELFHTQFKTQRGPGPDGAGDGHGPEESLRTGAGFVAG
jgi:ATP-binding cassette subfamily B protein